MPDRHLIERTAIIDIGSNSVRLVIYEGLGSVPLPMMNEKAQCALALHLAETGKLNPEGVEKALTAIARFHALIEVMQVKETMAIATAAVRQAKDGKAFVALLKKRFGLTVRVISGEEEAELAGLGVLSSVHAIEGMACDLGGGSLELAVMDGERHAIGARASWPLGVLALMDRSHCSIAEAKLLVAAELKSAPAAMWQSLQGRNLYAIGGSLRALAKIYMEQQHYPIKMLHQFTVPALPFREFCGQILDSGAALLPGMPRKRAETLAYAAVVLRRLIKVGEPAQIVFSMQGIREGLLYQRLVKDRASHDPLQVVAEELTACHGGDVVFGRLLDRWMQPAFAQGSTHTRWADLRRAASLLVTIPLYELSAERSELAFYSVLQAPLMAISHGERFLLSLAVMMRYQHAADVPLVGWEQFGTTSEDHLNARKIGALMHLAYTISGGVGSVLEHTRLVIKNQRVMVESDIPDLCAGEMVHKRLQRVQSLAATMPDSIVNLPA